jgi:hypothetical protein
MALYFAVEKYIYDQTYEPEDGAVWILDPHRLNMLRKFKFGDLTPSIESAQCDPLVTPAFVGDEPETGKVLCAMAAEKDVRIFVQQGCFAIHSDKKPLEEREELESCLTEIKIPAVPVRRVAFELDLCRFRKGDIFPDLSSLATELTSRRPLSLIDAR